MCDAVLRGAGGAVLTRQRGVCWSWSRYTVCGHTSLESRLHARLCLLQCLARAYRPIPTGQQPFNTHTESLPGAHTQRVREALAPHRTPTPPHSEPTQPCPHAIAKSIARITARRSDHELRLSGHASACTRALHHANARAAPAAELPSRASLTHLPPFRQWTLPDTMAMASIVLRRAHLHRSSPVAVCADESRLYRLHVHREPFHPLPQPVAVDAVRRLHVERTVR